MIFRKPSIKEIQAHSKVIYKFIIALSIIVIPLFSYMSYFTYNMTFGSKYSIYTLFILLPLLIAIPSTIILVYWGEKKFYKIYKDEEDRLYERLKRFYH